MTREKAVIKKAKQGDLSALDELIRLYYSEIFKYCCWHTKTPEQAEDATQDTFYKAIRFINAYKNNGTFRAFLYKIALNTCIDLSRKKSKYETNSLDSTANEITYSEIRYENIESDIDFNLLLSKLTDKQRELIILRYEHDLTLKEIAEITGSNLRTCQSNLRKALKQIEKNLERSKEDE